MKRILMFYLPLFLFISCDKEKYESNPPEPISADYRDELTGQFSGRAFYYEVAPKKLDSVWIWAHVYDTSDVNVVVEKGSEDSTMNVKIYYNKWIDNDLQDLTFKADGEHFSESGGGSSYSYLSFHISADSLHMINLRMCGMPCHLTYTFDLPKDN